MDSSGDGLYEAAVEATTGDFAGRKRRVCMKFRSSMLLALLVFLLPKGLHAEAKDASADAASAIAAVVEGLAQNRPVALWEALPASKQQGVAALLSACASRLDAESWRRGFGTIENMGLALANNAEFVKGSAIAVSLLGISSRDSSAAPWFRIAALLVELGRSPLGDPVQLAKLDIGAFLNREGRAISAKLPDLSAATHGSLDQLVTLRDRLASTQTSVLEAAGERVRLRLAAPGTEAEEAWFVKSEGKWLPERQLAEWDAEIAKAEARCAQFAQDGKATAWLKTLGNARDAFAQLAQATTQAEFDAGMSGVASAVGPQLAQLALDQVLGGRGIKLNVGSIIYTPPAPENQPAPPAP